MTRSSRPLPQIEFNAFGVAVGAALVCGGLSVLFTSLLAPTATLAALSIAGWVSVLRRRGELSWYGVGAGAVVSLGLLGAAAAAFLADPPILAPVRGLMLGGSLVPLFVTESNRSAFPRRGPTLRHLP